MIPGYTEKVGTPGNDLELEGLKQEILYGLQGDDVLTSGSFNGEEGGDPVLIGGSGDDRYVIKDTQSLVVIDGSNSDGDIVEADGISFNNEDTFFLEYFESTLVALDTTSEQLVLLPDWENPQNRIEEFQFEDETLSFDQFSERLDTSDKYVGNYTESQTVVLPNDELFNLNISGDLEQGNTQVRGLIQTGELRENPTLELTGGTAQIAYVAYYGRPGDPGGREFWNNVLTESEISYSPRTGDTLTGAEEDTYNQIVNQFGNSEEADRLFGELDTNRERVNRVYQLAFDRDGDEGGLDFWTEQLDNGNVTLATFALEIGLGAQNEDVVVLNNKIRSADLFSQSLDTEAELGAYSGSSGEIFGREWLNDYNNTFSSQQQVDAALSELVDG